VKKLSKKADDHENPLNSLAIREGSS